MKTFTGTVVRGSKRAAALGFPTINIELEDPGVSGIFAATVVAEGREYRAAAFGDPLRTLLEAHLLDAEVELYGATVAITLHKKLRDSRMFENDAALREAIASDVADVRAYFSHV